VAVAALVPVGALPLLEAADDRLARRAEAAAGDLHDVPAAASDVTAPTSPAAGRRGRLAGGRLGRPAVTRRGQEGGVVLCRRARSPASRRVGEAPGVEP
jgi:hypothetical protein